MPDDPKQPTSTTTLTVQSKDGKTASARSTTELELPNTPQGNLAKVYIALGLVGTLVVAFLAMMMFFMHSMDSQISGLREELTEARKSASDERKQMYDRYIQGREVTEKRHGELMTKLDKVMIFVERCFDYYVKDRVGTGAPKALEMK